MTVAELSVGFTRPWSVRVPLLTRYLKQEYVKAFFEDGTLRLSSFEVFRNHPDELRRDPGEGRVAMQIRGPNSRAAVAAMNGQEAYIMCASTVETAPTNDQTLSGFRILDTLGFASAVSSRIPGFVGGTEGLCSYRDDTTLHKTDPKPFEPPQGGIDVEKWAEEQDRRIAKHSLDAFFMKHSKFAHEAEYRLIWFASGPHREYLDIKCAEALGFCERL